LLEHEQSSVDGLLLKARMGSTTATPEPPEIRAPRRQHRARRACRPRDARERDGPAVTR
jgi:hypothetical protein